MKDSKEIIEHISLLYELSIAIGTSLDMQENCKHFLTILMRRMNIVCASVWVRNNVFDNSEFLNYQLVYGYPMARVKHRKIDKDELLNIGLLQQTSDAPDSDYSLLLEEDQEDELDGNICIVFNLRENGFIKIYFSKTTNEGKLMSKLNPLRDIMDKFALSMNGCIAHGRALYETQKRHRIQKELIASNDKYESVVRSIGEGLVITDLGGYVIFVNESMCRLSGYSQEEIIQSQGYKLMIPEEYWAEYEQKLNERKVGQSDNYEFPMRQKGGGARWVSVSATPYLNSDGIVIGSLALIVDITESKIAQQEILEGRKKLQLILNTSLDAIITIDEDSLVTGWNQSAERMTGYVEKEALGKPLHDLIIPPVMVKGHQEGMKRYLKTGVGPALNQRLELSAIRKSGEEFPIELSIAPIKIQDKYFFSAFLRDITQRKENENALIKAKQRAEKARNVERQFLAHMSHEIRTPMNAVIGMTYLLSQSNLSQDQSDYVEALKFSADSLMAIISDILDLSKIEAGEIELESRPFSLHYLLESLQRTYQFKVQEKNISVEINIDDKIQNQIIGDETRISQILGNLLSNASKFTSDGYIGVNALVEESTDEKYWIKFQVYDTGIGIAEENINQIFASFKQATIDTHREFGGTGLGLSIVKQLIELQGGSIRVESTLGQGTMFTILLPFIDSGMSINEEEVQQTQHNHTLGRLKELEVLIAEDNPINQKLIGSILEQWEVSFDLTKDGVEALEYSMTKKYDLIFMDINMPRMNGYEAVVAITTDSANPNCKTPIITLTAAALHEERKRMFEVGVSDFITKPFSPQLLQQTIINCLDEKAALHEPKNEKLIFEPTATQKAYDLSYLKKFSQGSSKFIIEMVQMFLDHNPQKIKELETFVQNENWDNIQDVAHQMKSTLGTLGMFEQQQIAKKIEDDIRNKKIVKSSIFSLIKELKTGCEKVYPLLKEELNKS
ncbi:PAS domain-containing hybrid sensor histidine kinase/response regulator [Aureispira anguillae]|uniref:Sensory/regulatory protein RpfC n=1 Tax=Aureispira anguillae TaxID=2864201 RepID=A0A915YLY9_9BACT|nr:PAS domain-containing hybrid sensor histidine kinase/response regulator [Aureispira anguillae]BDS15540.1 PAS domain S-box protein [Aureispira anguillae]